MFTIEMAVLLMFLIPLISMVFFSDPVASVQCTGQILGQYQTRYFTFDTCAYSGGACCSDYYDGSQGFTSQTVIDQSKQCVYCFDSYQQDNTGTTTGSNYGGYGSKYGSYGSNYGGYGSNYGYGTSSGVSKCTSKTNIIQLINTYTGIFCVHDRSLYHWKSTSTSRCYFSISTYGLYLS